MIVYPCERIVNERFSTKQTDITHFRNKDDDKVNYS